MTDERNWTHLKQNTGMGLEEQHLLRWQGRPVSSLKWREHRTAWEASLLERSGISARLHEFRGTLEQAKLWSEEELRRMGWEESDASSLAPKVQVRQRSAS